MKINAVTKIQAGIALTVITLAAIVAGGAYYKVYYIPPPSTIKTYSYCHQIGSSSINSSYSSVVFSFSAEKWRIDIEPNVSQLAVGGLCVYNSTTLTLPVRCGTMCGGGVGDIIEMAKQLEVNMSIIPLANNRVSSHNLTLSFLEGGNFSALFFSQISIYINSHQVSSDASPPCYNSFGEYEPDCSSVTVEFPETGSGTYSILVNSSEELVP